MNKEKQLPDSEQKYLAQTQLEHLYRTDSWEQMAAFLAYHINFIKERLQADKLATSLKRHFEGIVNYAILNLIMAYWRASTPRNRSSNVWIRLSLYRKLQAYDLIYLSNLINN